MKKFLSLISLCILSATSFSQGFEKIFSFGTASFTQQTTDGGFIVAASNNSYTGYLLKLSESGDTTWTRTYNSLSVNCVKQTADGGYIFSGSRRMNSGHKVAIFARTNEHGDTLFTKTFSPCTWDSYGGVVNQSADGSFYFDASGDDGTASQPYHLYHLDSAGNILWHLSDPWYSFQLLPSSSMIVSGNNVFSASTFNIMCDMDFITLAKINESGIVDVHKTFVDTNYQHNFVFPAVGFGVNSICQSSEGNIIVAGYTNSSPAQCSYSANYQYLMMNDADGDSLWSKVYDEGFIRDAEFTKDGSIIMVGKSAGNAGFLLRKTDLNGNILWEHFYNGYANSTPYSVRETIDGGFLVAAVTSGYIYIVKTNSDGLVSDVTGISSSENKQTVSLFPNPFHSSALINISAGALSQQPVFILYDAIGNEVRNFSLQQEKTILTGENLSSGIYFYRVNSSAREIARGKLVVE